MSIGGNYFSEKKILKKLSSKKSTQLCSVKKLNKWQKSIKILLDIKSKSSKNSFQLNVIDERG